MGRYELFVGLLAFVTTPASSQDQVTALSGDVIFGAFFTVNELDNGDCGDYSAGHLEEVIAVTWFLKSLNDRNCIPGIKIGQKPYHDTETGNSVSNLRSCLTEKPISQGLEQWRPNPSLESSAPIQEMDKPRRMGIEPDCAHL
ncbi:hypothetical protein C0Q70_06010 [Pomacea canaliculata]|uniref:Receptor ligand binding region domain-containing protein n=1 Tax=Pomacea canaliculata TaxID=400727 RepID=A0A2T7PMU1_POMCA|nr:hypothetical protein C0Q70_06010 [Pomacea canaliculata]